MLKSDAVRGEKHSCTIAAQPAVNENGAFRLFGEKGEEFGDLFIGWWSPTIAGNQDKLHAQRFRFFFLFVAFMMEFTT